jgi:hypothetical protein
MDIGNAMSTDGADPHAAPTQLVTPSRPAPSARLRVLTILARFGTDQYADAEATIADLFARQLPGIERDVIVVDNALPREYVAEREGGGAARRRQQLTRVLGL